MANASSGAEAETNNINRNNYQRLKTRLREFVKTTDDFYFIAERGRGNAPRKPMNIYSMIVCTPCHLITITNKRNEKNVSTLDSGADEAQFHQYACNSGARCH